MKRKVIWKTYLKSFIWAICVIGIAVLLLYIYIFRTLPASEQTVWKTGKLDLDSYSFPISTNIYSSDGVLLNFPHRMYTKFDDISPYLKLAIVNTEDKRFYEHTGFDPFRILKSLYVDLLSHRYKEGGSTITQQLARNMFLSFKKTITRKLQELALSIMIERYYTKDEILERYMNIIYLGANCYGVGSASLMYFGMPPKGLDLAQSALLAGIIRSPSHYSPFVNMNLAFKRQKMVLNLLLDSKLITKAKYQKALEERGMLELLIRTQKMKMYRWKAPYFVQYVRSFLKEKLGLTNYLLSIGGYTVYTTLDYGIQITAERALRESGRQGGICVIDSNTGYIKAMVGGKSFSENQFNRVTQAKRQMGSAFKPFYYTYALLKGYTPDSILPNYPKDFNGWEPQNYDKTFSKYIPLQEALIHSVNVPSINLFQKLGVSNVLDFIQRRFHISSHLNYDLSSALGSSSLTPLEVTSAYAMLANGGVYYEATPALRVEDRFGRAIYVYHPAPGGYLDDDEKKRIDTTYLVSRILEQVITRGTGVKAQIKGIKYIAGKTGTTDNYTDAWFVGYSPHLVCAVFIGNDDNSTLGEGMTGGKVAAPIWKKVMKRTLQGTLDEDFPHFNDVTTVKICTGSLKLAGKGCPKYKIEEDYFKDGYHFFRVSQVVDMTFIKGTEPTEVCSYHKVKMSKKEEKAILAKYSPALVKYFNFPLSNLSENETPTSLVNRIKMESGEEIVSSLRKREIDLDTLLSVFHKMDRDEILKIIKKIGRMDTMLAGKIWNLYKSGW